MNRRRFLAATTAGAWFAVTDLIAAPKSSSGRRTPTAGQWGAFTLEEATLARLQAALQRGQYTARSLVEAYLDRLAAFDRRGPTLNAVIEPNPDALATAKTVDEERKAGRWRGPLHGIPVLIKDNLDTADRMKTTAGSLALADTTPSADAFAVRRLRAAGAVLLGKTNLSEWANFRSTKSTSGWSARGGLTRNPYALDRNPCGSSSGSAVAVAANLCAVALGTETNGSIVSPASANGIVGLKPTLGLVSRSGIVPIAHSQDTAGPMTRTVADAAMLLGALVGYDPADLTTASGRNRTPVDYVAALDPRGLRGTRIGVARRMFGFHPLVDPLAERALDAMKAEGAILIDLPEAFASGGFWGHEIEVLLYEFKDGVNRYLTGRGPRSQVRSLEDLIAFNERHRDRELRYFGQELFVQAQAKGPLTDPAYAKALAEVRRRTREQGIDAAVTEHRLEAIVAPTMGPTCVTDLVNGDHFSGGAAWVAAGAGYPSLTVPAGEVRGLPVGMLFFGPEFSEATLLKLGFAFEQATQARRVPRYAPSVS